ncbi:FadR/GntR family transcriptional regulator [Marinicrinis sediminis]|uniref:FadR/GntR family transcriptional regulator n=1 Tax=Marinicrinis sediminis TaxID=1652465 RepID=A0ABW5R588_9BACL
MDSENASSKVYKMIEGKILTREWLPGTKITSENNMATELNVSRVSVREAIEKLVGLGVLVKKRGEGTYINELAPSNYLNNLLPMIMLDTDGLIDIIEFRMMVEEGMARQFAEKATDEELAVLKQCFHKMKDQPNNPKAFYEADFEFHMTIAQGSKNPLIMKVMKLMTELLIHHQKVVHDMLGPEGGVRDHQRLIEAFEEKDGDMAALLMRKHLARTLQEIREKL